MDSIVTSDVVSGPSMEGDDRYCWVCFATDEDDKLAPWVQPCNCRGATKWVHQTCLQRWVDEKQKGNTFRRVSCPQCQSEYIIVLPSMGSLANVLEGIDTFIKRISPFLTAGVIVGSIYWTAVTYGAVTILQTVGYNEGLALMERAEPVVLLIGLPAISIGLILGRMIRWEEFVLKFLQTKSFKVRKFPMLSLLLPISNADDDRLLGGSSGRPGDANEPPMPNAAPQGVIIASDPLSATRVLCGALLLPTISSIVGRLFFDSIRNNFQRALVGGFVFIVVKGALKIYFKQKQFNRKKQRRILDYTPENIRKYCTKE
ncbi:E3 ubiquitin-protein ligase MARCHF5-like [Toxorhynchites rutilus septentrionalis]|uniref:E3 ubiquitin-protein ligase MARCHF5-like n=1 Tax=Toxorhynchites rutilus septentrionalis TaxID=329112 RepID=UPI00247A8A85|nr:E3 ubiquitin-protein ligase MARCHF5-like [Toxorhynchites rutilus septentrionalis]XP_055626918.1 E3 ubiquitin-protein ligase MARCHF5-like [Toxorhynchites rutilus septentrionalis]XP_055626927.1 E3 ubiquitin-protein ligase MARCHF5-like [Toxorhynchites rutilus septentrionalis]